MKDNNSLLFRLGAAGFGMIDLNLYLDTHPLDASALSLFGQYKQQYMALAAEYEAKHGPLTAMNGATSNSWKWVADPWPWEYDANVEVR